MNKASNCWGWCNGDVFERGFRVYWAKNLLWLELRIRVFTSKSNNQFLLLLNFSLWKLIHSI